MATIVKPMFICHANCCRSVLAYYLYSHLCNSSSALSAGFEPGSYINDKASAMLKLWGINSVQHQPKSVDLQTCEESDAIFLMGPLYLLRLLREFSSTLANKSYLFADPFSFPSTFQHGEYLVHDPSFDNRTAEELVQEFSWMPERVIQIDTALSGNCSTLIPASEYKDLLESSFT
jgi:protein-tyrosine-phosphatase